MNWPTAAEQKAQFRPLYRDYKAGLPVGHIFACGHTRWLRAYFDRKLKPVNFETWLVGFLSHMDENCYDCQKAAS